MLVLYVRPLPTEDNFGSHGETPFYMTNVGIVWETHSNKIPLLISGRYQYPPKQMSYMGETTFSKVHIWSHMRHNFPQKATSVLQKRPPSKTVYFLRVVSIL